MYFSNKQNQPLTNPYEASRTFHIAPADDYGQCKVCGRHEMYIGLDKAGDPVCLPWCDSCEQYKAQKVKDAYELAGILNEISIPNSRPFTGASAFSSQ